MTRIGLSFAVMAALISCSKPSKESREICERAAVRYTECVGEVLGPEAKELVSRKDKDGRDACARDDQTVDLYRTCLPKSTCNEFMDCMMDYAEATAP